MISAVEQSRRLVSRNTDSAVKSRLGQFMTPANTAAFMAGLFPDGRGLCRLLDAGAGVGSLSAAFLERWTTGGLQFDRLEVDAFEIDPHMHQYLEDTLARYRGPACIATVRSEDFVHASVGSLSDGFFADQLRRYSHAILNPPYRKITSSSEHRSALRRAGIETVNLYSAFVALALELLEVGGHLVAIIPRSFCNGPYYRPFREFILERAAIQRLHLFESRAAAFKDDGVLQENIIVHLVRGVAQGSVAVSTSTDDSFADLSVSDVPFHRIMQPEDPERFIHVPTSASQDALDNHPAVRCTLADLGVEVSTGPVIDFRLRSHLREMPETGTVPLLYPTHFQNGTATWPVEGSRKPNAIVRNEETERWLYPAGHYCVVRRFSSKEEPKRIVASLVDPAVFGGSAMLGFENHLNVFHHERRSLPHLLARGLAVYLNSTPVDQHFRRFNGHTQVNATDLRQLRYPSRECLMDLGSWAEGQHELLQSAIDDRLEELARCALIAVPGRLVPRAGS